MEDRIVVNGKIYYLRTSKQKNAIVTYISLEVNGKEEQLLTIKHKKSKKEKLMKFHKKALSFFFQALQKKEPLSEESFQEIEDNKTAPAQEDEMMTEENIRFQELCGNVLHQEVLACFLLKDNDLLNYVRENNLTDSGELIVQISSMIDFIRDNKNINQLVGKWQTVIDVYDAFQIYCKLIVEDSILVIVSSRDLPVGSMIKMNEETKEVIEKEFFNPAG